MIRRSVAAALMAALAVSACSDDEEPRLQGERIPVRAPFFEIGGSGEIRPVPPAEPREEWSQAGGDAGRYGGHAQAPASLSLAWSADAGAGFSDRVAASDPVISGGKVFVRDGEASVFAFDAASGRRLWEADLAPPSEYSETGFGGGLAIDGGKLFATTGFGEVVAVSPETGEELWRHKAGAPFRAAPGARGGLVIAVTAANTAIGLNAETGERLWEVESGLARTGNLRGAAPAIGQDVAALPFGSGELMLVRGKAGSVFWSATVVSVGAQEGLAAFPDITSDPVLGPGPSVIAGNAGGALALFEGRTGRRVWQRDFGSLSPVWQAGDTLFVVSTDGKLLRLALQTGDALWVTDLPVWEDPEDREDAIVYAGPVLAGGRVLVTSSDGRLLAFDPQTGAALGEVEMPDGSRSGPAVAGGTVYVLTDGGDLLAYR